jgi:hypothetical protein
VYHRHARAGWLVITVYARGGNVVVRTTLSWRRAMLLSLELTNLATEPFFRAVAEKDPPGIGPGGTPAGGSHRPASK